MNLLTKVLGWLFELEAELADFFMKYHFFFYPKKNDWQTNYGYCDLEICQFLKK